MPNYISIFDIFGKFVFSILYYIKFPLSCIIQDFQIILYQKHRHNIANASPTHCQTIAKPSPRHCSHVAHHHYMTIHITKSHRRCTANTSPHAFSGLARRATQRCHCQGVAKGKRRADVFFATAFVDGRSSVATLGRFLFTFGCFLDASYKRSINI